MATKKKSLKTSKTKKKKLVAFSVTLFSISYIGTLCRTAIFAGTYFAITVSLLGLSEATRAAYIPSVLSDSLYLFDTLRGLFIMTAVFAIYDAVYVTIAKRYGIFPSLDRLALIMTEIVFLILWWLPLLVPRLFGHSIGGDSTLGLWFMVFAALLPPFRAFVGVSLAVMRKSSR